ERLPIAVRNKLAYETRVGSPPDFQLKRVSAPSCLRALNRSAQAGRRARSAESKLSLCVYS
ncbi:hypothetical protein CJI50_03325, partial [Bifidobacteriaceae bacterium NR021]